MLVGTNAKVSSANDITFAYWLGKDLQSKLLNIIAKYYTLANGVNDITLSGTQVSELIYTKISSNSITINFKERGYSPGYMDEPSGWCTEYTESTWVPGHEYFIPRSMSVPFHLILKTDAELDNYLIEIKKAWDIKKAEEKRLAKISELKSRLAELEAGDTKI